MVHECKYCPLWVTWVLKLMAPWLNIKNNQTSCPQVWLLIWSTVGCAPERSWSMLSASGVKNVRGSLPSTFREDRLWRRGVNPSAERRWSDHAASERDQSSEGVITPPDALLWSSLLCLEQCCAQEGSRRVRQQTHGNKKMSLFPNRCRSSVNTMETWCVWGGNNNPSLISCRISTEAQCGAGDNVRIFSVGGAAAWRRDVLSEVTLTQN